MKHTCQDPGDSTVPGFLEELLEPQAALKNSTISGPEGDGSGVRPSVGLQGKTGSLPLKRYAKMSEIDASRYSHIEVEALALVFSDAVDEPPLRVLTEEQDGPPAIYSVFLRVRQGDVERIADFATCIEAVEYAEFVMAYQADRGTDWTRGGRIFDLYCVSRFDDDSLFLERGSTAGACRWVKDPAEAMVFNRHAAACKAPTAVLMDTRFKKQSWLAAQVLYARAKRHRDARPVVTVFLRTIAEHRYGPSFARVQVTTEFALRLLRLQRLCMNNRVREVRADAPVVTWRPCDMRPEHGLGHEQLVVTREDFEFVLRQSNSAPEVRTLPQNIVAFLRAACAHSPGKGALLIDDQLRPTDWAGLPA